MDQPITRAEHISIHALCEEGDSRVYPHPAVIIYFYPRPLRGGRRAKAAIEDADEIFLSTPSARRATLPGRAYGLIYNISIHALCEEGDAIRRRCAATRPRFLSTPSARRATALRCGPSRCPGYFYPRPLRGGRLTVGDPSGPESVFLSTPSARRATCRRRGPHRAEKISIHALCEEGDHRGRSVRPGIRISIHALCEEGDTSAAGQHAEPDRFLSTPSARRATRATRQQKQPGQISIHALCEEGDMNMSDMEKCFRISIHALCEEGDLADVAALI